MVTWTQPRFADGFGEGPDAWSLERAARLLGLVPGAGVAPDEPESLSDGEQLPLPISHPGSAAA